ncbi:MAG: multi-sensor signal transduction histidine kinase [Clostridia bacterium]|nr:multi-sensor signal transduction histidine kinase [Clostridia bacterium]
MKPLQAFFKGQSIYVKLLIYFLSLILLPISTLGIIGNFMHIKSIEDQSNIHTMQMIDQIKKNVEFYIHDMENIIYYISQEPKVIEFLRTESNPEQSGIFQQSKNEEFIYDSGLWKQSWTIMKSEVKAILKKYNDAHPEIAGILVVNKSDSYISNQMYKISRDSLTIEPWYVGAKSSPKDVHLFSKPIGRNIATDLNYSADDVVAVAKAICDPKTGECIGVVLIDMKLDIIEKVIKGVTLGKSGFIYIMDECGGIVYAPINPIVYRVKDTWFSNSSNSIVKVIKNNRYQIIYKDSQYTKWKVIGVFSLSETLEKVRDLRYYSLIIGGITLLLAVSAALFFTASIARPVRKLQSLMQIAEAGDLSVRFESKSNDEIGQLGNSFNNMIEEIQNLIQLVYTEQKSKREAELKTLQAQIKPHFLYNTLDTIQWMAQEHGAGDIVEIIAALTRLFRIGLSKGKEIISVCEELEHVKSYLVIQKARYEDKLEYEIHFDQGVANYGVPKLILQPLVENAIYHGIKARRGVGRIAVSAKKIEEKLFFSVTDNGIGMTSEKMAEINTMLENKELNDHNLGYGIFNVNERIRLTFGPDYGLNFNSIYGKGTTVEIWLPINEDF